MTSLVDQAGRARSEKQVEQQLSFLRNELECLEEISDRLAGALEPMIFVADRVGASEPPEKEALCELASRLRVVRERVESVVQRFTYTLEDLQL